MKLRLAGWLEYGHIARCGHYWVHPDYPSQKWSIHEAEKLLNEKINYEKINYQRGRSGGLDCKGQEKRIPS